MWKVRPSEVDGYIRNYSMVTPEGDEINVDFNFSREMVRVSVKLDTENGREYFAVIKSGTILQERDVSARRPVDLTAKVREAKKYFKYLPDDTILRAIGGNYELPTTNVFEEYRSSTKQGHPGYYPYTTEKRGFLKRIRDYLEYRREEERKPRPLWIKILRRFPDELFDLSLAGVLTIAYMGHYLNLTEFAGFIGALGIFSGAWDWLWRQRNPFLPRVILLLAVSAIAVYYQIQYRVWGIFL